MTATSTTQAPKFVPVFAMPIIAPPPTGYSGDPATYYSKLALQTMVVPTPVEILPEQTIPPANSLEKKGLVVTVNNPANSFQPDTPLPSAALPPPPFATLFALMGGDLEYRRSTDPAGLNPLLPPPFDALATPLHYPAPAGLTTAAWGTLRLRVWGTDFKLMKDSLKDTPPCGTVYYLGVDEASLEPLLKAVLNRIYPQQAHLDHIAATSQLPAGEQKKPPLRQVVETVRGMQYPGGPTSATPSHAILIGDYFDAFLNGNTSLLVGGGTPIAKAIEISAGLAGSLGRVELWFLGEGPTPQFISPIWTFKGAPTYAF
jgi:hypothetical protein